MVSQNLDNGWAEWSKYVLKELERLNLCYNTLDGKLDNINYELIKLKVKAGVWGAISGAIPAMILVILYLVFKG